MVTENRLCLKAVLNSNTDADRKRLLCLRTAPLTLWAPHFISSVRVFDKTRAMICLHSESE
jgi:hypothetical protein